MQDKSRQLAALSIAGLLATVAPALAQGGSGAPPASGSGAASTQAAGTVSAADRKFIKEAATGGMLEVDLGKLAAEKATHPDVKAFGQRMVDDHGKANDRLKQIAAQKGVTLPTAPGKDEKALRARLDKLSGAAFDRAYVGAMVKDHRQDVAEFNREARRPKADPDVKSFAADTLTVIKDHYKMALDLQASGRKPAPTKPTMR